MVPGQIGSSKLLRAVQAYVGVPLEQRLIVQRRHIAVPILLQARRRAPGRDNGIDLYHAAQARQRAETTMDAIQGNTAGVGHLSGVVQPHGIPIINPLQRHAGNVRAQNFLAECLCQGLHGRVP